MAISLNASNQSFTDIPLIFIPGTSGSSLDTSRSFTYEFQTDSHPGVGTHDYRTFNYNPEATDPAGPRVWIGPEGIGTILQDTLNANRGNHYLDVLQYDSNGYNTVYPQIGAGTILEQANLSSLGWPNEPIYDLLINFLTSDPNGPGRPLNQGHNGLYLFPYDWRADLPDQVQQLSDFVENQVLNRSDVSAQQVVLLSHSLGGLVGRAYYLSSPDRVAQMISVSGGFGGILLPLKILTMGDIWGFGFEIGSLRVGFAEWETEALGQNWGTAYYQLPNSDQWFSDDKSRIGPEGRDRSYIRDETDSSAIVHINNYGDSVRWIQLHHNALVTDRAETFYANLPTIMGDFSRGTGNIPHHRLFSRGVMTTVNAIRIYTTPAEAAKFAIATGASTSVAAVAPVIQYEVVTGDGDGTVPYHGLLGNIALDEQKVYVFNDNVDHISIIRNSGIHLLIKALLDGTVTNQPQAHALDSRFLSPNDAQGQEN
jgi:pimeloyl-ACP methyl ester carboxylesterase